MSDGHSMPDSTCNSPVLGSRSTTRFIPRMSSRTECEANCCPPVACLLPETEIERPCLRQSLIKAWISATETARTTLRTQVGFKPVWTSFTSTSCETANAGVAARTGATVIPFKNALRRSLKFPPTCFDCRTSQSHVQRGNQFVLHAEIFEEPIVRIFKLGPGPE